jgi:hypothetical protein
MERVASASSAGRAVAAIRLGLWLLCLALGALASPAARAEGPEAQANTRYEEAKGLMGQGAFGAAVEKLTEAYTIFPHPLIIKKRGEAYEKLVDFQNAVSDYKVYLEGLTGGKKAERKAMTERIGQLESLLQKPVSVRVVSSPPGVMVAVDGGAAQRAPFDARLTPGTHVVRIADPRFSGPDVRTRVLATAGQSVEVKGESKVGRVMIRSSRPTLEGITVSLDAEPMELSAAEIGRGATETREVSVGRHNVVCATAGSPNAYVEFDVREGALAEVECTFFVPSGGGLSSAGGWTMVGLGIAGVVAGTGLLVSYALDVQTAEDRNQDLVTNKHWIGGAVLGAGVVLGVASYWVFTADDDTAEAPRMVPFLGANAAGTPIFGAAGAF